MKVKPLYIYLLGIVIAAFVFLFVTKGGGSSVAPAKDNVAGKQMPQDEIHKGLQNPNSPQPDKNNVSEEVKKHLDLLKKAVNESPNDTLKIKQYADFLAEAHQQDAALEYYNKILKIDPKRTDILFAAAYINYVERKFDAAESLLNNVLSIDKKNLQASYNIGAIAFSKGDKNKAKQVWSKLAKEHPGTEIGNLAKKSLEEI